MTYHRGAAGPETGRSYFSTTIEIWKLPFDPSGAAHRDDVEPVRRGQVHVERRLLPVLERRGREVFERIAESFAHEKVGTEPARRLDLDRDAAARGAEK
jgi:hypothetical protein